MLLETGDEPDFFSILKLGHHVGHGHIFWFDCLRSILDAAPAYTLVLIPKY